MSPPKATPLFDVVVQVTYSDGRVEEVTYKNVRARTVAEAEEKGLNNATFITEQVDEGATFKVVCVTDYNCLAKFF